PPAARLKAMPRGGFLVPVIHVSYPVRGRESGRMADMQSQHIVRAYDAELATLGGRIAAMGGLAERMVEQSVSALVNSDVELARRVIADDQKLDEDQRWVDERAVQLIAKRQPMAADLREI